MKIIAINAGSSSLKFSLFDMENEEEIASGLFERIGLSEGNYKIEFNNKVIKANYIFKNHEDAVNLLLKKLIELHIINDLKEINGVGHRVVQGKDLFNSSVLINDEVINKLEGIREFDPLHNPANVLGIKVFAKKMPNTPMIAVFDTTFHQTMNKETYLYPVPYEWYSNYGIRKYGAHGTSHEYIMEVVSKIYGTRNLKIISCHIGSGASIAAIKNGKSIDTSMGFTPLAGIMMGTRSGDIDPSIIPFVMEKENKTIDEVMDDLNKKSGLFGLSGISSDMRDILEACKNHDERALLARDKFVRRIVDYIAAYYVLLEGADVIVFTAGVGENSAPIRKLVCEKLACLGVKLDLTVNRHSKEATKISTADSKIDVYDIDTNEELMIARETLRLMKK